MKTYIIRSLLFFVFFIATENKFLIGGEKEEREQILTILNDICKRKDIDNIKPLVDKKAKYFTGTSETSLLDVLIVRDKDRALGHGSYEELLSNNITIVDEVAYVLCKTKWFGKQVNSYDKNKFDDLSKELYNTIIFERIKGKWTVIHWHASEEGKPKKSQFEIEEERAVFEEKIKNTAIDAARKYIIDSKIHPASDFKTIKVTTPVSFTNIRPSLELDVDAIMVGSILGITKYHVVAKVILDITIDYETLSNSSIKVNEVKIIEE